MSLIFIIVTIILPIIIEANKYSKEANVPPKNEEVFTNKDVKDLEKPFRMQKVNLLWEKAQKRLSENRLKFLFSELKIQDKEELNLKKLKSSKLDKEGQKEAEVVQSFNNIIHKYNLENRPSTKEDNDIVKNSYYDPNDKHLNKNMFKDKKLNKLWVKAEQAGITGKRLKMLKEEFQHHQDKVDQMNSIIDLMNEGDISNNADKTLNILEEEEIKDKSNLANSHQQLKEKRQDIKKSYHNLANQVLDGNHEFDEPEVEKLWGMAQKANFTSSELDSLHEELSHYEQKIKKLHILREDYESSTSVKHEEDADPEDKNFNQKRYKEYHRKVEKLHRDFEARIHTRHSEL